MAPRPGRRSALGGSVDQGADSYWSFCVDYLEASSGAALSGRVPKGRGKDYREILSPADFAVFAKLRELRKQIALSEAVPVYTVFTNEQLAQMVETRTKGKHELESIAGVGDARIEKYGPRFLDLLKDQWNDPDETSGKSV